MQSYTTIGCMSGTSLDGLDIVACRFTIDKNWSYEILKATNVSYSIKWMTRLSEAFELNALDFTILHNEYGKFTGKQVAEFCAELPEMPMLVSSHGHTIYHQPELKLTVQIGSGANIAATCGIPTVCDFRSSDVALGGQGAPLVPIGDELLFGEYEFCLNLGGIANVSFRHNEERIAFDICPSNMAFNHFTKEKGYEYDLNGSMGRSGNVHPELLKLLNSLDYYKQPGPRSLGREWFEANFLPLIYSFQLPTEDILRTLYEHVSDQLTDAVENYPKGQILITGGGAHNVFLIELFSEKTKHKTIVPSQQIIDFKEAVIFAFLGVLRLRNEVNCLKSVTGAHHDHCGGVIYLP
ncbi:MAG TPA: anhydro-N-acetylmuramic acid kinase [Prolixibacteraceae bacterium]|nr:anhydro-N-acetylmuramic acid kinase [Prolixibacteraceae bacterium]